MLSSNTSGASEDANYIESVFSTYLYTGNGSTQTITNGIDLAGKGGLVWCKNRTSVQSHELADTARGYNKSLRSNTTDAQFTGDFGGFNADGFSLIYANSGNTNESGKAYASWTFRKQPKFFDVVTYTGNGTSGRQISHSLGSTPGCVIVKRTDSSTYGEWFVSHRSLPNQYLILNGTDASGYGIFGDQTDTYFTINSTLNGNANGGTYVAYVFAHNAGGFGLAGTDNVISCGSFTSDSGGNATVNLGYEPQFVIFKRSSGTGNWITLDTMRGWTNGEGVGDAQLNPNTSNAESTGSAFGYPTATGFQAIEPFGSSTYIYIAIRRGPMKVPTDATKVFTPVSTASASSPLTITTDFPVDLSLCQSWTSTNCNVNDRLRGSSKTVTNYMVTSSTGAETAGTGYGIGLDSSTSIVDNGFISGSSENKIYLNFRRAPSFFDEVCFETASISSINHNLGVAPELMIAKVRNTNDGWYVWHKDLPTYRGKLNTDAAFTNDGADAWGSSAPTSTTFTASSYLTYYKYVWYGFATCPGVSKVGSYTGTGTTKQIDCGFAAGARFVMIKRTDSTGNWYVWDTARGIVSGNDPYLTFNGAGPSTTTDYVDTYSTGFEISSTAPAAINASGGTFIFLAIA